MSVGPFYEGDPLQFMDYLKALVVGLSTTTVKTPIGNTTKNQDSSILYTLYLGKCTDEQVLLGGTYQAFEDNYDEFKAANLGCLSESEWEEVGEARKHFTKKPLSDQAQRLLYTRVLETVTPKSNFLLRHISLANPFCGSLAVVKLAVDAKLKMVHSGPKLTQRLKTCSGFPFEDSDSFVDGMNKLTDIIDQIKSVDPSLYHEKTVVDELYKNVLQRQPICIQVVAELRKKKASLQEVSCGVENFLRDNVEPSDERHGQKASRLDDLASMFASLKESPSKLKAFFTGAPTGAPQTSKFLSLQRHLTAAELENESTPTDPGQLAASHAKMKAELLRMKRSLEKRQLEEKTKRQKSQPGGNRTAWGGKGNGPPKQATAWTASTKEAIETLFPESMEVHLAESVDSILAESNAAAQGSFSFGNLFQSPYLFLLTFVAFLSIIGVAAACHFKFSATVVANWFYNAPQTIGQVLSQSYLAVIRKPGPSFGVLAAFFLLIVSIPGLFGQSSDASVAVLDETNSLMSKSLFHFQFPIRSHCSHT